MLEIPSLRRRVGFREGGHRRLESSPFMRNRNNLPSYVLRGGAVAAAKKTGQVANQSTASKLIQWMVDSLGILLAVAITALLLYVKREDWQPWMDKERIQSETLRILSKLHGDDDASKVRPLILYAVGMALWESIGLSTIPVETAAGMVFGWKAFYASAIGKSCGATLAFFVGRTCLYQWVQRNLFSPSQAEGSDNTQLLSLLTYNRHSPLVTALLMKFSFFPEFVKNLGTAVLFADTVGLRQFATATAFHGSIFSLLWTWLGVETALELQGTHVEVSWLMRFLFPGALAVGMGLPFVLMGWWANDLREEKQRRGR
jgi:uncharacterized membrane protein YdjX (TVP38/TMEM64 family)